MLPMRLSRSRQAEFDEVSGHLKLFFGRRLSEIIGIGLIVIAICIALALVSWSVQDPSFNQAVNRPVSNLLGRPGAMLSDIMIQLFGLGAMAWLAPLGFLGFRLMSGKSITPIKLRIAVLIFGGLAACAIISALPIIGNWPLPIGLGGITGDAILNAAQKLPAFAGSSTRFLMRALLGAVAFFGLIIASGIGFGPREDQQSSWGDTGSNRNESFADDDEEEADHQSDPNIAIVWLGALFHGVLSVKNAIHRWYVARVTPDDPFNTLHSKRKGRMEPGLSENHAFEQEEVINTPTPTRISFQVTSKIDSRTILGEQGAEQLLGQGDMLFMAGGGRISRVHGPFVSDGEVEKVVAHLKAQGRPNYLDDVTREDQADFEDGANGAVFDQGSFGSAGQDPYDQAVAIVLRDRKASTSYIQRRLQIGYNRAASIMERMEDEGVVGQPNHAGKREILIEARSEGGRDFDGD